MSLVWVTRAEPGAGETAARLREFGFEPLVDPLLQVHFLSPALDLALCEGLVFTSRNGVAAFARLSPERALPVLAVGAATAEAARAEGFAEVESADGDVRDLARLIGEHPGTGWLLHPSAVETAEDLGPLTADRVVALPVYETTVRRPVEAIAAFARVTAVLIHSPKAARAAAALDLPKGAQPLWVCISERAVEPLRRAGWENLRVAPFPAEAALLKVLGDSSGG